jgi:hypothetical protein
MRGVPVWSHDGILCTGETYKDKVKLTFAKGASLDDPAGIFNSSLEGNTRRAIDLFEGDKLNAKAATIVRDLEGAMRDRYGARAERSYLIRPDGYVGWCSEHPSLTAFRDYLANVFVCP